MSNTVVFKSVRSTQPALYEEHTFHMKKCVSYTYNYAPLDDYILQHWETKTMSEIADDMNEYYQRVHYRVQVLQKLGLIRLKVQQTGITALKQERRDLRLQLKIVEQKLNEIGAA